MFQDELFVISVESLPSGEDIHIDNETGAFVTHDSVRWWLKVYKTDVQYRTKAFTDSSECSESEGRQLVLSADLVSRSRRMK